MEVCGESPKRIVVEKFGRHGQWCRSGWLYGSASVLQVMLTALAHAWFWQQRLPLAVQPSELLQSTGAELTCVFRMEYVSRIQIQISTTALHTHRLCGHSHYLWSPFAFAFHTAVLRSINLNQASNSKAHCSIIRWLVVIHSLPVSLNGPLSMKVPLAMVALPWWTEPTGRITHCLPSHQTCPMWEN